MLDLYFCMICGFLLICCVNCVCVSFFVNRFCKMVFFTSAFIVLCVKFLLLSLSFSVFCFVFEFMMCV